MAEPVKTICCCASNKWAQVIGWIQVVVNATTIAAIATYLVAVYGGNFENLRLCTHLNGSTRENGSWRPNGESEFPAQATKHSSAWIPRVALDAIVQLILGLLLLFGSYNKKPRLLAVWVTSTIVWLVSLAVLSIVVWFLCVFVSFLISIEFVVFFMYVSVKLFCILVVVTHKEEMELVGSMERVDQEAVSYTKF